VEDGLKVSPRLPVPFKNNNKTQLGCSLSFAEVLEWQLSKPLLSTSTSARANLPMPPAKCTNSYVLKNVDFVPHEALIYTYAEKVNILKILERVLCQITNKGLLFSLLLQKILLSLKHIPCQYYIIFCNLRTDFSV